MTESAKPVAWMRKWQFDGEIPRKEKNANGRLAWPKKFLLLPVTVSQCARDDVPLYPPTPAAAPPKKNADGEISHHRVPD